MRDETPDYGIDVSVEVVSDAGYVTGRRFFVQLKSTDTQDLRKALSVKLKISTFRYFQSLGNPVLVVVYHAPFKVLYGRWVHDMDVFYAARSKKHFTFRFDETDRLSDETASQRFTDEIEAWKWLRSPSMVGPLVLRLNMNADTIWAVKSASVIDALRAIDAPLADLLEIREVPRGKIRGEITVDERNIHVRLFGGGGSAIHQSLSEARAKRGPNARGKQNRAAADRASGPAGPTAEEVAADILAAIAMAAAQVGQIQRAAQIAEAAFPEAAISANPDVAGWFVQMLITAGRHDAVVRGGISLWKRGFADLAEAAVNAVFLSRPPTDRRLQLEAAFEEWLSAVAREPEDCGRTHYNVGRYIGIPGWKTREGILHFLKAARLAPDYRNRGYFWEELGAMFFHDCRFRWAAEAYGHAAGLGRGGSIYAKRADALWRTGRYATARDSIEKYKGDNSEFLLLKSVLSPVIDMIGIGEQLRQPQVAERMSESIASDVKSREDAENWLEVLRIDGMSSVAWFNLGVTHATAGRDEGGALAFLVASLIQPDDTEAWANFLVTCTRWGQKVSPEVDFPLQLFQLGVTAGAHRDRDGLFRALMRCVPPGDPSGRQLLQTVFELVEERWRVPSSEFQTTVA